METDLKRHLVACAEAYAGVKRLEMVTVARLATGDWRFFERIETGASFTARKYDGIMGWFARHWPTDTAWPTDVPRPVAVVEQGAAA